MITQQILDPQVPHDELEQLDLEISRVSRQLTELISKRDALLAAATPRPLRQGDQF